MGVSQNWTVAMQYRSRRSAFLATMVQAKKVPYSKTFLLARRVIFGNVRVQEGADNSTLFKDLFHDLGHVLQVICHYDNTLGTLVPFQLICKTAMFVVALLEIFHERWGAKKDGLYLSQ